MCRPASCLLLRERSPRGPARLVLFPPPALSLGGLRRGTPQIASTARPQRIPREMTQDARAGGISPDGPGAIPSNARPSPITFFMRPVPLAGAGGSSICTLSSDEISTLAIRALPHYVFRHPKPQDQDRSFSHRIYRGLRSALCESECGCCHRNSDFRADHVPGVKILELED